MHRRKKALLDHLVGAGSPEKQKINDDEGCDYGTGAEGEHVANVVSGHALACLDRSFDGPFVVPFRHENPLLAEVDHGTGLESTLSR